MTKPSLPPALIATLGLGGVLAALVMIVRGPTVRAPSVEGGSASLLGVTEGA